MPSVRSGPSSGKSWVKIQLTSTFDLRLLGLWGVMNIINSIARGVSPCVRAPPSLAAEERMLWERSTKVVCAECMKMCCLGGKNSVVKGLMIFIFQSIKVGVAFCLCALIIYMQANSKS